MRCPNCSAECSDVATECEFCGQHLNSDSERTAPVVVEPPPLPSAFESDNPYAASESSSIGSPPIPVFEVPNHLVLSIIATGVSILLCCFPFGIIAVIFSVQVNSKLASGDYEGAKAASANAKRWAWICIAIAISLFVLNTTLQFSTGAGK